MSQRYKAKISLTAAHQNVEVRVMEHGFMALAALHSDAEKEMFFGMVNQMHEDFDLNKSSDFYAVEFVALNTVLYQREAMKADPIPAKLESYDRIIRLHLDGLSATRQARIKDEPPKQTESPAEWASKIVAAQQKKGKDAQNEKDEANKEDEEDEENTEGSENIEEEDRNEETTVEYKSTNSNNNKIYIDDYDPFE